MSASRMPAMYLPHGGGPSFFMSGERRQRYQATEDFLRSVRGLLPATPTAILIATAHWETRVPSFTGGERPALIYDYYGFPPETYALRYDAPGHPALARRAASLLRDAGHAAVVDPDHGWDHGAFIPLKVMFPDADIPVVAMSLQAGLDPALHCDVGAALQSLRDDGVLIVGAGMSYHNLRDFTAAAPASYAFHDWLDEALSGNRQARAQQLSRWHEAPGGRASHPREEHLLPLMLASGAGSDLPARRLWRGAVGPSCLAAWAFD
ncbi:DODA-type extradiol aromatic ring-opening family dioxygenase [Azohydromonas aeria]|uniref:DODA-type extradiol aromatic ring-opening family dioxygenase n=1 Tax=Azohydromonas aeria TaxID=2590212 RepID=UPI001E632BE9|nr:class III extradiol ring-cleavage dioxygenase [Azohydromonas aeria]